MILDKKDYKKVSTVYKNMLNQFETFDYTIEDLMKDNVFIFIKYNDGGDVIIYQSIREICEEKQDGLTRVHFSYSSLDYPYRMKGIGTQMFQESINFFKDKLKEDFLLTVYCQEENYASRNLLKKFDLEWQSSNFSIINHKEVLFINYNKVITV